MDHKTYNLFIKACAKLIEEKLLRKAVSKTCSGCIYEKEYQPLRTGTFLDIPDYMLPIIQRIF